MRNYLIQEKGYSNQEDIILIKSWYNWKEPRGEKYVGAAVIENTAYEFGVVDGEIMEYHEIPEGEGINILNP
ncbi:MULTISPECIES: hypothetical protein [Paraliobacillus]|nr:MULTISPECIES: hypothetical protein [Paraliobacillus]